jgi:hypothetical protein
MHYAVYPTITVCIPSLGQRSAMLLSGPSTSSAPLLSHWSAGGKWIPDRTALASDVSQTQANFTPSRKTSAQPSKKAPAQRQFNTNEGSPV